MEYLELVTMVVTFILGMVAKKVSWFKDNLIPVQNLIIGVIMAIINYVITKDFSTSLMVSGLLAGGVYDLSHNLGKIIFKGE